MVNVYGLEYPGHDLSKPTKAIVLEKYENVTDDNKYVIHLKLYEGVRFIGFAKAHYKQCEIISKSIRFDGPHTGEIFK